MAVVAAAAAAAVTWVSSAAAAATAFVATGLTAIGVGSTLATAIAGNVLTMAASTVASAALTAILAPRANTAGSPISFKADPSSPIRGVMGRFATGGTQNHFRVWGKDNLMISFSVILSLGPIQGIEKFEANDQLVTFPGANGLAANVEPYKDKMWMTYKLGLPTDGALGPPPTGGNPRMDEWTANHRTSGYAGAFWTMQNNSKRASFEGGVPKPIWTLLGQKLYDPRKDSTQVAIGGVGAHRLNDWRTWEYSQNNYVHALNWALGHHKKLDDGTVDRTKLLAGVGASVSKLDLPTFVAAANVADANNWTISGEWNTQDDKWQVFASMLQAGSGMPCHVGAKIGVMVNAPRTPVATITSDDIIGRMNIKVMASRRDRFNTIYPRYINEGQNWEYSTAGGVTATAYRDQDNGEERSKEITYNYVDKSLQAGQLAGYDLANTRETLKVAFPAKPHLVGVKPGDAVLITSYEHGLNAQKFVVMSRPIDIMDGTISFEMRSETDSKHAFALGQTDQPAPSPGLTPFDAAPSPPEEEFWAVLPRPPATDGTSQPGLEVVGEVPDGIGGLLVEHGPTDDGPWTQVYDGPPTTEKIDIVGLEPGTDYYVAFTHRSVQAGVPSDRLVLGPFTTPKLVANDSLELGGRTAEEILADIDGTQEQLDLALAELDLAIANLDSRTDAVEADINDPTTGLIVRVGTNEQATEDVADRVTVVEQSINTPGTGLLARAATLEQAVVDLDAGKASSTRVALLESQVQTPGTGLLARAATLEQATIDLASGKADASRVAIVEAAAMGATPYLNPNPLFDIWPDASTPSSPPSQWSNWLIPNTLSRIADGLGGYAVRTVGQANTNSGGLSFLTPVGSMSAGDWIRVEADVEFADGSPLGSGVYYDFSDAAGAGVSGGQGNLYFTGPDATGRTGHENGKVYRYSWLIQAPNGNGAVSRLRIYGMAHWVGFGQSLAGQNVVDWHLLGLRKADASEVEQQQARGGFASLSARYVSLETATTDLQAGKADVSRVSALEARAGGSNLLKRSQFFLNNPAFSPWSVSVHAGAATSWGFWGNANYGGATDQTSFYFVQANGTHVPDAYADFQSEKVQWEGAARGVATIYTGAHRCNMRIIVLYFDANGTFTGLSDNGFVAGPHANLEEAYGGPRLADFKRIGMFFTPPANTASVQILVRKSSTLPGNGDSYAFQTMGMLSRATPTQTEFPPWSAPSVESRVVTEELATADLYGKTLARWANGTAVPGAATFIYAQSESSPGAGATSDVGIGAKTVSLFNQIGNEWKKALEVSGSNAIFSGGLQAGAFIRLGNGQGWPVALKPVDFNLSDGEVCSFGTDLGALPIISFAQNNLAPLNAGETYDVGADNLSPTGFTMRAKINIPATPADQTATGNKANVTIASRPGIQIWLQGKPDSKDGTFRIQANGVQNHAFQGTGGGIMIPPEYDSVGVNLALYAYKGGVWTLVTDNITAESSIDVTQYPSPPNGGPFMNYVDNYWSLDETYAVGAGATYLAVVRIGASNGRTGYVGDIPGVYWQSQGAGSGVRSATPSGQKTRSTVRPQ